MKQSIVETLQVRQKTLWKKEALLASKKATKNALVCEKIEKKDYDQKIALVTKNLELEILSLDKENQTGSLSSQEFSKQRITLQSDKTFTLKLANTGKLIKDIKSFGRFNAIYKDNQWHYDGTFEKNWWNYVYNDNVYGPFWFVAGYGLSQSTDTPYYLGDKALYLWNKKIIEWIESNSIRVEETDFWIISRDDKTEVYYIDKLLYTSKRNNRNEVFVRKNLDSVIMYISQENPNKTKDAMCSYIELYKTWRTKKLSTLPCNWNYTTTTSPNQLHFASIQPEWSGSRLWFDFKKTSYLFSDFPSQTIRARSNGQEYTTKWKDILDLYFIDDTKFIFQYGNAANGIDESFIQYYECGVK